MPVFRMLAAASVLALTVATAAAADCSIKNDVPIKSLSAGFEAWKAVTTQMTSCGDFSAELDQEFAAKQPQALAADPALYQIAGVANDSIVAVLDAGTIRPLDDLVAKYGQSLSPNQLIKLNGKIMAIAMMVNTQNLLYRADVLDQLHIPVPKTYDEVLAAAEKIKASGLVAYPLGGTLKTGWNLGEEFVNMYLALGGQFFGPDDKPQLNSPAGVKALEMLKRLSAYMDPEFLTADSTVVQQQFQQGKIALANFWASRAGAMDDAKESKVVGKIKSAPAPLAVAGGKPATTLWWDGASIAKNTTDAQAEAAFKLIVAGMSPEMVAKNNDEAIWLIKGYKPGPLVEGAISTLKAGAPAYPVSTQMGLIHTAIGKTVADYLNGTSSAEDALAKADAAYVTSAKDAGVLK